MFRIIASLVTPAAAGVASTYARVAASLLSDLHFLRIFVSSILRRKAVGSSQRDSVEQTCMQFGDFELTPLFDGFFRLDGGAMFGVVPKPLWEKRAPADDKNRITLAMRPLLVRSAAGVDADRCRHRRQDGREEHRHLRDRSLAQPAITRWRRPGSTPIDIDIVLASHLHFDHAGGFTTTRRRRHDSAASSRAPDTSRGRRSGRMPRIRTSGTARVICRRTSCR